MADQINMRVTVTRTKKDQVIWHGAVLWNTCTRQQRPRSPFEHDGRNQASHEPIPEGQGVAAGIALPPQGIRHIAIGRGGRQQRAVARGRPGRT